jgi:hypothetical protein
MAAEHEHGTTTTFVVRYPDGASEFRMSRLAPEVGDLLTGRGDRWVVAEVAEYSSGNVAVMLQRPQPDP